MSEASDAWSNGFKTGLLCQERFIQELLEVLGAQTKWLHVARERREALEDELKKFKSQPVRPTRAALLQPMTGGGNG